MNDQLTNNNINSRILPLKLHTLLTSLADTEKVILSFLDDFHYAYGSQIQRLFFVHGTNDAMIRARNRILTKLTKEFLVYRYPRKPLPGNRHGSTEHIYALAHAGQRIMNELRASERPFRSVERTTAHYDHALAVTELHVRMVEVQRTNKIKLIKSQGEPACHRHFGLHKILKPDAYFLFHITHNSQQLEVGWFIEIEHSRQGEPATIAKINAYRDYMEQLNPAADFMPRVLFVAFKEAHNYHLERLLSRNTGGDRDVFKNTLFENAIPTILSNPN